MSAAAGQRHPVRRGLIAFLLRHLLAGVAAAAVFEGALLAQDFAGIRGMALASPDGPLYLVLLFFGLVVTFGGVAMAAGVMLARRED